MYSGPPGLDHTVTAESMSAFAALVRSWATYIYSKTRDGAPADLPGVVASGGYVLKDGSPGALGAAELRGTALHCLRT